jgi:hypothetical protein
MFEQVAILCGVVAIAAIFAGGLDSAALFSHSCVSVVISVMALSKDFMLLKFPHGVACIIGEARLCCICQSLCKLAHPPHSYCNLL